MQNKLIKMGVKLVFKFLQGDPSMKYGDKIK